ncbi:radical SAM/SPASM domain-containing protein [Chloroflexota bacterium]
MIEILTRIPQYMAFRKLGFPRKMPMNVTLSVTYKCNSRCKTCNVWQRKVHEMTLEEIDMVFQTLGKTPYWFTMSGGEPFLREDLSAICRSAYERCRPKIISIPTNGILYKSIPSVVSEIAESCPDSVIVLNLSLDGIREQHNQIRGVPGNWERSMKTYESLKKLKHKNLEIGVHSVISTYNVSAIPEVFHYVQNELMPDSYITEIAEERNELGTIGSRIAPEIEQYAEVIEFLSSELKKKHFSGLSKITQSFRLSYYKLVIKTLREKRQVIPCYAGSASAHIAPDGDIWACCIRAESIGNLREVGYDFSKVWFDHEANLMRRSINKGECYCPLANSNYTNILLHPGMLARVIWRAMTL